MVGVRTWEVGLDWINPSSERASGRRGFVTSRLKRTTTQALNVL